MRRFEFSDSTSNKFWEVDVKGKTLNVTFGKIGTKGQSKPKDFASPEKAKAEMEKLIKEKTGKGYVEVGGKAVKEAKPAAAKKTNAESMGKELSKAEKKIKAEKVLLMFANGQWKLARGILKAAQEEHWLFEELLEGCKIKDGKPVPSSFLLNAVDYLEDLVMLELFLHLPKGLKKYQKLSGELGIQLSENMLSKYWKEVVKGEFEGIKYGDPEFFTDQWYEERKAEIVRVEKDCEARSKALNKAWREEEDLGNGIKLEMVLIPAGKFVMGSPKKEKGRDDDETQHEVTLTKPFYMGKYEVTQEQWEVIMGSNPSDTEDTSLPVTNVSWDDCKKFIKKLNAKTGGNYRLPTEAEWEYACKAGTNTAYSFGDKITPKDANCPDSEIGKPIAVGSYKPNTFGLYDMHGNVWEWCEDWKADYLDGAVTDPKGPSDGTWKVVRGGSFGSYCASRTRASGRLWFSSNSGFDINGFRLVKTI